MTVLEKAVKRQIPGLLRHNRSLVVTLYPHGVVGFREARRRKEYTLPLMTCYKLAILAEFEEKKAAKKAARKGRKIRG